jgi:hypothetical protein
LKGSGCYAEFGHTGGYWRKVSRGEWGGEYSEVIQKINGIFRGQLWRFNIAGDLLHVGEKIAADALAYIVKANKGKRGFTYTHHDVSDNATGLHNRQLIKMANKRGFTVNLSANNLEHADILADLAIGPVVTLLPIDAAKLSKTPSGRDVVVCPAVSSDNITCASCGICQKVDRKSIIGFPVHGVAKKKAFKVFTMVKA